MLVAERARWLLWLPVAFGSGIALYFTLPVEPPFWPVLPLCMAAACLAFVLRPRDRPLLAWALVLVALAFAGFAAAQWRTHRLAAPVIAKPGSYEIAGRVLLVEPRGRGPRVTLGELSIEGIAAEATPAEVRVTLRSDGASVRAGDRLAVRARLQRPSGPLVPDGFDFARQAYFDRLGGLGYAIGPARILERGDHTGFAAAIARLRQTIADEARAAIPGAEGAVAAALLTALRADIPDRVWRDMQLSGLAHLLAISGLHMGLVAGTVFLTLRYLLCLVPSVALRWPVKKPAALVALLAIGFYLLLAGASVPAQRAFMMAGVGLLALMIDRNPFSLRLVAVAALAVLMLQPESLLGASFQMSFAAVVALVAFYEAWNLHRRRRPDTDDDAPRANRPWRPVAVYLLGVALTTLVAGLATTPFAAYHFQRIATFGLIANLLGVPLTAFWIMPSGLLALLAMPFGWAGPFLQVMGAGVGLLLHLAAGVAALPGAGVLVVQWPVHVLVLVALGGLWLCFWSRPWRVCGLALWALALIAALAVRAPDLLIDRAGSRLAWRDAQGAVHLWRRHRRDGFVEGAWLRSLAVEEARDFPAAGAGLRDGVGCDASGCRIRIDGRTVAIAFDPAAALEDCREADLIVSTRAVDRCPGEDRAGWPQMIGSRFLWLSQGIAVRLHQGRVAVETIRDRRGRRPWTR
ncbi:MAG: ComEC/Rec2 family competence protein [Geminicoccaceae bacterium]|nr:ComEC/Rec2 family competence protein [Geminicoccaceae bacterium]